MDRIFPVSIHLIIVRTLQFHSLYPALFRLPVFEALLHPFLSV